MLGFCPGRKRHVQGKYFLLRNTSTSQPGGVEYEYNALFYYLTLWGIKCEFSTKDDVHTLVSPGDVVYIQEEGRLYPDYLHFANSLLSKGVTILEKNVFALPSKFRPVNPNYRMILMSHDGIFRYSMRGSFKRNQQEIIYLVPNIPYWILGDRKRKTAVSNNNDSRTLRIMRAGRADTSKWTGLESELCQNLCKVNPNWNLELSLIGCPRELKQQSESRNFKIKHFEYSTSLEDFYIENDYYLLYSKIGETFGNTIFEALYYNLRVLFLFDISWDCAPIEYLNSYSPNSRSYEISNLETVNLSSFIDDNAKEENNLDDIFLEKNRKFFTFETDELIRPLPSFFRSIQYLFFLGRRYNVPLWKIMIGIIKEILRERNIMKLFWKK